jgi:uncharacterized protein (TIGR02266 family)
LSIHKKTPETALGEHFRRTDPRYDRRVDVEISSEGQPEIRAITSNVSLGGMFVETNQLLTEQTRVQVRFKVPTQPEPVEVTGEVRWIERGDGERQTAGMGIRFQGLRARDVWALNRFFQS